MSSVRVKTPLLTEPMVIQKELEQLEALRRTINLRIDRLTEQLGDVETVPLSYLTGEISLYALELEGGCYYIGMSRNPEARIRRHMRGKGATWTKKHKPIRMVEVRNTGLTDDTKVAKLEDQLTIEYAKRFGHDNVRGGSYCNPNPLWPEDVVGRSERWIRVPDPIK